ncbi:hypothetical protein B0H19DRAFT_1248198 [Mycena capillaripes]|nr:hypothetical protein B0H19DRAFT_1248198 [Mycena capillaripes]
MTSVDCTPELDTVLPTPSPQLDVQVPPSRVSSLGRLPEEIVEYVAECIRYPIYPRPEATEAFLSEGRSGCETFVPLDLDIPPTSARFSAARFSLSSFSKTCKAIRINVERLLYRDIHVDIIGWTRHIESFGTQKHPIYPAGCLRLLLRTLEERPDLRRFVRSVAIRWSDFALSAATVQKQLGFLRLCPGLQSLAFSSLSESLLEPLKALNLQITSFAAVSPASDLPHIIRIFPNLIDLHLHIHGDPSSIPVPDHGISRLHLSLRGDREEQKLLMKLALTVPRDVRALYLEGKDPKKNIAVINLPLPTPSMQASVEHLHLKTIDPFKEVKIDGLVYSPLATMTALRHLHVMRPFLLPVNAFSSLPPSLRSITFSDYALGSTKSSADSKSCFVQSVVDCLNTNSQAVRPAGIKTYGAIPDDRWELGDLVPLQRLCRAERVPFIQIGAYADIEPELIIFVSRLLV